MELELPVRWDYIYRALTWYNRHGYTYIEVPWVVPSSITRITYSEGTSKWRTGYGDLVGSAEQGFLSLLQQGRLKQGVKYVTCTPCFREESELSTLKHLYFMKVELFRVPSTGDSFHDLVSDAA
jgi:seryl-tRNA synthetase